MAPVFEKKINGFHIEGLVEVPRSLRVVVEGLSIQPGSITFIRGPSGCGKTSMLRKICGSEAYAGNLRLPEPLRLAFVMHETTLIPWLTVDGNLRLEAKLRKSTVPSTDFDRYLSALHLNIPQETQCGTLSMGMRQRVEIARALSFKPELFILDEAWSGIDAETRLYVFRVLDTFVNETQAMILATSHADVDVLRLADRVYSFRNSVLPRNFASTTVSRTDRIEMSPACVWDSPELVEFRTELN